MNAAFELYKPRKIDFKNWVEVNNWVVKIYTITNQSSFGSNVTVKLVESHLPNWLNEIDKSKLPTYKQAFLIIHEAREGVWILLNWWTGGEMIETKVYFSNFKTPNKISNSPHNTNALICVWELEVFAHERKAWIKHILKKAKNPDFYNYKLDVFE